MNVNFFKAGRVRHFHLAMEITLLFIFSWPKLIVYEEHISSGVLKIL